MKHPLQSIVRQSRVVHLKRRRGNRIGGAEQRRAIEPIAHACLFLATQDVTCEASDVVKADAITQIDAWNEPRALVSAQDRKRLFPGFSIGGTVQLDKTPLGGSHAHGGLRGARGAGRGAGRFRHGIQERLLRDAASFRNVLHDLLGWLGLASLVAADVRCGGALHFPGQLLLREPRIGARGLYEVPQLLAHDDILSQRLHPATPSVAV